MLNKIVLTVLLGFVAIASTGCIHTIYSSDPLRRNNQLLYSSENMRLIQDEWARFWMLDMPSHMTPYRTHGGVF